MQCTRICAFVCVLTHFGWKSWRGAVVLEGLLLFKMMRDARKRKSSSSCWIREGPETKKVHLQLLFKSFKVMNSKGKRQHSANYMNLICVHECIRLIKFCLRALCETDLPNCSFSLPQRESRVLMRRRWPACSMLSASLVSSSLVHVGSKLSSHPISSSNMTAGLICSCSISEAAEHPARQ